MCNLEEIITDERREKYRQAAYAKQRQLRTIRQNRDMLWKEVEK